ncbi:monovalent cation/H+ antiporter complex subunit F [Thermosphaera aggregans]|jgi:multicomponent Na+:H+ antiporter subunit F|uniref:Multiple resistance and pH regulation protein F n=1 Tax=Thermosphaera aggregans (strain DSM 11486 / M11TL) TaxID=633148 RepID=D5U1A1_THEAM|nr:monovalent cation/H+ antiporter complex subunit F [Thermosphaera aggregans]ADG90901.1 multiple resistance and pH regulation protein F [Thermosphaera aggregans DSM 11486]
MDLVQSVILVFLPLYLTAIILYLIRAIKGPTIGDQVLAIDSMTYDLAALLIILGLFFKEPILIVTAIPLALWIYSLDIYIAKYLDRGEMGG